MSITIDLPPEIERFVAEEVSAGRFASPEEVIAEGIRFYKQYTDFDRHRLERLRADIEEGYVSIEREGKRKFDPADMMRRIDTRLAAESGGSPEA